MTKGATLHDTFRVMALCLAAALFAALTAGCSSSSSSDSDFNSIIPEIIRKAQGDPTEANIVDLVNTASPDAQRAAIQSIQDKPWGHDPGCMKAYRTLSHSPSPMVRGQAMRALASAHNADCADVLVLGLSDKDPQVRRDASQALIDIRNPLTISASLEHLKNDEDAQVRSNVARSLKGYNDGTVLRALAASLDDPDVGVAHWAHRSIQETVSVEVPGEARPCLQWVEQHYPERPAPPSGPSSTAPSSTPARSTGSVRPG